MKKNVCAYARVSTKEDLQLNSLDNQVGTYVEEIMRNPEYNFCGIYADVGKSGTSTASRNEFNDMIDAARNGYIDLIIVKSISRFARNTVDSLSLVHELRNLGVEIYFENEDISSFDSSIDMMLSIMSAFAEEEARQTSENVKWSHRKRMREGKYSIPTKIMLGFKRDEDDNIVIDEDEAKIIRLIYKLYLEGYGISKIANYLENNGFKTKKGKSRWSHRSIASILENEKYKGDATMQKTFVPDFKSNEIKTNTGELPKYKVFDTHPAIIDDETFDKVQELRRIKSIKYSNYTGEGPKKPKFTRFLICKHCGKSYLYRIIKEDKTYSKEHFRCSSNVGRIRCDGGILSNIVFEPALLEVINEVIRNKRNFAKDIEEILLNDKKYKHVKNRYNKLNKKLALLRDKLKTLDKDSNSFNEALKGRLEAKLKELLIERSKYYKLLATTYNIDAFIKTKRAVLDKFNQPINDINEFPFRELFSQATVLSPSSVVFHLGFVDHNIKKEPYLDGEFLYKFRHEERIFKYYLVV